MVIWKEAIEANAKQLGAQPSLKTQEEEAKLDKKRPSDLDPAVRFGLPENKEADCAILKSYFNFEVPSVKIVLFADKQELDSSKGVFD